MGRWDQYSHQFCPQRQKSHDSTLLCVIMWEKVECVLAEWIFKDERKEKGQTLQSHFQKEDSLINSSSKKKKKNCHYLLLLTLMLFKSHMLLFFSNEQVGI